MFARLWRTSTSAIHITYEEVQPPTYENQLVEQAISAGEWTLCQLMMCFEFESRSERRKGQKSCSLLLVLKSKVQS